MLSSLIPGQQNPRRPKTHSKQALEKIRAKHAEAQRAEQARADAKAGKSPAPAPEQAHGYFASIRNFMPSLPFKNWFFGGPDVPVTSLGESSKQTANHSPSGARSRTDSARQQGPNPPSSPHEGSDWSSYSSSTGKASRRHAASSEESPSPTQESPAGSKRGKLLVELPEKGSPRTPRGIHSGPVGKPNRRPTDSPRSPTTEGGSLEDSPVAQRSKERGPEGWSLSPEKPRSFKKDLSPTVLDKAEEFQSLIRQGYEPSVAAARLGPGTFFKHLKNSDRQFEIRLNRDHRLSFQIDTEKKVVTLLQIGGHT